MLSNSRIQSLKIATYAWKLDTAVTALGRGAFLLDVQVSKLTTGSLDHSNLVRPGVVSSIVSILDQFPNFVCSALLIFHRAKSMCELTDSSGAAGK